ncbi:MAG: arylmalonate decarboxylase [Rhodobacteraceae bacterium]|nr:arylmalonate decarboxylase [Paracoccaceae bacterium]
MTDACGWRLKFGVLGPSTNTTVQPEFDDLRLPGITNHYSRIYTPNAKAISNDSFMAATMVIASNVIDAVKSVMTCEPDYLVMGMSAITFYGGNKGADEFQKKIEDEAKVGVSVGSHSCTAALKAYGGIKRIAFLSPYYPAANTEVKKYFEDNGFECVRDIPLQAPTWTGIAEINEQTCIDTINKLNGPDVDAIVQVGTNLSMMRLAGEAEKWIKKPVIAINTATYWHALRANGVKEKIYGFGKLLEDF